MLQSRYLLHICISLPCCTTCHRYSFMWPNNVQFYTVHYIPSQLCHRQIKALWLLVIRTGPFASGTILDQPSAHILWKKYILVTSRTCSTVRETALKYWPWVGTTFCPFWTSGTIPLSRYEVKVTPRIMCFVFCILFKSFSSVFVFIIFLFWGGWTLIMLKWTTLFLQTFQAPTFRVTYDWSRVSPAMNAKQFEMDWLYVCLTFIRI